MSERLKERKRQTGPRTNHSFIRINKSPAYKVTIFSLQTWMGQWM